MVVVPLSAFRLWRAVPEMCGIAGIFHMDGATPDDGNALEAMQRSLVHRGPDGHGSFVRGSVRLTMRRLSIIDVEGGVQPINNETDTVHVVLNGEIYNFQRLRETLEAHGHRFRTHSDTETIVHAYEECVKVTCSTRSCRPFSVFSCIGRNRCTACKRRWNNFR